MKIELIYIGKKSSDYEDKISEYKKRISRYIELSETRIDSSDKIGEGKKLIDKIKSDDYVILLDETGSDMSSLEFAELLDNRQNDSVRRVCIIVGGAYGVSDEIIIRANQKLRMSRMVWPHELARLMICEQVYRAYNILEGTPYHHT